MTMGVNYYLFILDKTVTNKMKQKRVCLYNVNNMTKLCSVSTMLLISLFGFDSWSDFH